MSGLKVVFFFPLLPEEDIIIVVVDFLRFKRGGEAGKKGFQPMRKKLGEKFGVVFSFAVVVTDTELHTKSRKSTGGSVFILCNAAVSWKTKKQRTILISSTEAEYVALSEATKEAISMK